MTTDERPSEALRRRGESMPTLTPESLAAIPESAWVPGPPTEAGRYRLRLPGVGGPWETSATVYDTTCLETLLDSDDPRGGSEPAAQMGILAHAPIPDGWAERRRAEEAEAALNACLDALDAIANTEVERPPTVQRLLMDLIDVRTRAAAHAQAARTALAHGTGGGR